MPRAKATKSAKIVKPRKSSSSTSSSLSVNSVKRSREVTSKRSSRPARTIKPATIKGFAAPMFDISGKSQGTVNLPKEIFGQIPNKTLLAQAVRVYFNNQSTHNASTKTRSEIRGGGRKPWRQKGTGRARAGSTRSPLWVGGGITFGPRPRKVRLALPQKMKQKALISALSSKRADGEIIVISNFEKMEPKTKIAVNLFKKLQLDGKTLLVLEDQQPKVKLAVRNIPNAEIELFRNLNAYKVLTNKNLIFAKGAINADVTHS